MTTPSHAVPISGRGLRVPPSPIRKLVPFAEKAKAAGVVVHHLNIGQPDVPTPPGFFADVARFPDAVLAYGHSAGFAALRDAMASYYHRLGHDIGSEHVTVTTGGSEAILFAMMACCDPGDEIVCFEPFYTNYNGYAVQAAVTLRPVRCSADDGYHLPARERIEAAIGSRTRAILICSPNNPTGAVLRRDEMATLVALARERRLFLISDEAYREFVYGEVPHTSVLDFPQIADRAILLDSLSKRYSVCGARVGCVVTRNADLGRVFLHLGQARLCSPSLEQHGSIGLLSLGNDYFAGVQAEYRERRDAVMRGLATIPGASARTPEGAFYVMAKLAVADAGHFATWLLTDFRLGGETVMVAPGDGFYATPGLGLDEIRIAYVLEVPRLERAMRCLREALASYQPG
jgi:aspartate aminotransferase